MNTRNITSEEAHEEEAANNNRRQSYAGIILIGAGVLSIISEIVALIYSLKDDDEHNRIGRLGIGIWAGALCVVAGCCGIKADSRDSCRRRLTAFVVFSLTASAVCLMDQFNVSVHGAMVQFQSTYIGKMCPSEPPVYQRYSRYPEERRMCLEAQVLFAMEVILTVTAFVAGMTGIYGAVFSCRWICRNAVLNEYRESINRQGRSDATLCGISLIFVGLFSITFNSVAIYIRSSLADRHDERFPFRFESTGHGIWSGTLCILAGITGVATGKHKNRCKVMSFVIFSLAATVACFLYQLNYGLNGAYIATNYDCSSEVSTLPIQAITTELCTKRSTILAMHALLAVTAIFGGMAGIWAAVICQQLTITTGHYVDSQSRQENAAVVPNAQLLPTGDTMSTGYGIVPSISVYPRYNVVIGDAYCDTTTDEFCDTNYTNSAEVDLPPPYEFACLQ